MTERDPSSKTIGWRVAVCAGLAYAVLSVLAFPPFGVWVLALVAPAPLLWGALRAGDRPKRTALWVALGTAPFWAYEHFWIADIAAIGFVPVVLVLCTYTWILIWALARVHRRLPRVPFAITAPIVWAGWEVFRGQVAFDGYPWFLASHPLIDMPRIVGVSLADPGRWIGAYGVSMLVVALSAAHWGWWRMHRRVSSVTVLVVAVLTWLVCSMSFGLRRTGEIRVAVVQTNVPQSVKGGWSPMDRVRTLDTLIGLSKQAAALEPDLIVWPETMFPGLVLERAWADELDRNGIIWIFEGDPDEVESTLAELEHIDGLRTERWELSSGESVFVEIASFADAVTEAQRAIGVPMIVGAGGFDRYVINDDGTNDIEGIYNSTFLIRNGVVGAERYDKLHLTPFGEVMPYISAWAWLESTLLRIGVGASGMSFDLDTGDHATTFTVETETGPVRIATPICFEATNPHVCARLVGGGRADLLVQLTNDGWFFWRDAGRRQHAQAARWRCVELGVPLVRAANTGVSSAYLADGQAVEPIEPGPAPRSEGVYIADVTVSAPPALYGRIARVVSWVFLGGATALLVASFAVGRTRTDEPTETEARG